MERAELCGREHLVLFEHCAEIAAIVIADLSGYLIDVELILQQQQLRLGDTPSRKILKGAHIQAFLEQSAKTISILHDGNTHSVIGQ